MNYAKIIIVQNESYVLLIDFIKNYLFFFWSKVYYKNSTALIVHYSNNFLQVLRNMFGSFV